MRCVRLTSLAVVLCWAAACGATPAAAPGGVASAPDDPGATSRQTVLDRYADGAPVVTLTTPSIMGRSPEDAEALLAEAGLDLRLVAFDRARPITVQHPSAGLPVPLDGVIEGWLGQPPDDVVIADATAPPPPEPVPIATPTPVPTLPTQPTTTAPATAQPTTAPAATAPAAAPAATAPAAALAATAPAAAQYVLPPHTDGLLRTNPRQLPAVPFGTELIGNASWYGPGFHGLTTACGGTFDQNAATLATRELRCGTVVRITGPSGLTVEATVTDWGPAEWTNRRFDLSAAVFDAIAPIGAGVVPVRLITANVPS